MLFQRKWISTTIWLIVLSFSLVAFGQYVAETKDIRCGCQAVTVRKWVGADFDQGYWTQFLLWGSWKAENPGLVDSDRLGNATYKYNCHSYAFNGSDRWIDAGADGLDKFFGDTSSCWQFHMAGTVKSSAVHSMLTSNNTGKCGNAFLCKNNQYVYGADTPTTPYKKIP